MLSRASSSECEWFNSTNWLPAHFYHLSLGCGGHAVDRQTRCAHRPDTVCTPSIFESGQAPMSPCHFISKSQHNQAIQAQSSRPGVCSARTERLDAVNKQQKGQPVPRAAMHHIRCDRASLCFPTVEVQPGLVFGAHAHMMPAHANRCSATIHHTRGCIGYLG